jgi:hypothetical protein
MKKGIMVFVFLAVLSSAFALPGSSGKNPIVAGMGMGFALERGSVIARLTPCFTLSAGMGFPLGGGSIDFRLSGTAGALVGSVLALEADALYGYPFAGPWHPRVGATLALDWGDYVFASETPAALPPYPLCFAGFRLDPLRFGVETGEFSALSVRVLMGLDGSWRIVRWGIELFCLEWRL